MSRIGYRMLNGDAERNKIFPQALESAEAYYLGLVTLGKAQGDIYGNPDHEMGATVFRVIMLKWALHCTTDRCPIWHWLAAGTGNY